MRPRQARLAPAIALQAFSPNSCSVKLRGLCASSWVALVLLGWLPACAPRPHQAASETLTLLPRPRHLVATGPGFRIVSGTPLLLHDTAAAPVARYLRDLLGRAGTLLPGPRAAADTSGPGIHFSVTAGAVPDSLREHYQLRVTAGGIWLRARTPDGLFWGVQTLRQLLPAAAAEAGAVAGSAPPVLQVPGLAIQDRPAFTWRGLMLDASRHFLPAAQLRNYVDLLALHKLNRLHLHLTDDQGWRLPAPAAWPRLTSVGAFRAGPDGRPYGGFYSRDELAGLVAYARQHHVELVPEIDLPGHVQAALAAYPELSCTGRPLPVVPDWGVHEDVLCVGNPKALQFAADVLGEVMDQFPGRYVHVGGDETPTVRWRACPRCQALMRREGLRSEHELQGYFLRQVAAVLAARGRQPLVWDESLGQPLPASAVVQAWHGLGPVAAAARAGHSAVASPSGFAYFDQNTAILDLPKVLQFKPMPAGLARAEQSRVLGGEAALWTERIEPEQVDRAVFPRLLAMAEVLWAGPQPNAAYPEFLARARRHYPRLTALGVQYGFETRPLATATTPTPTGLRATLTPGGPGIDLHLTLDGTAPSLAAPRYTAPLEITTPTRVRVLASRAGRPLAELPPVQLWPHAATGVAVVLATPAHPAYPAGGPRALTDGVLGGTDYRDGNWQGFEKTDLEATLDLGRPQQLDSVRVAFLQDWNSWIFLPRSVQFSVSTDGQLFAEVAEVKTLEPLTLVGPVRRSYGVALGAGPVRYLRVRARNVGVCPPGHPGAGGGAFLMADEVLVRTRR